MALFYYPQIDAVRIDANGYRQIVGGATFNVQNVTQAVSLGTLASDAFGVIAEGSFNSSLVTVADGDVIELSHATYPLKARFTLQATQELAYTAPENDINSYIVENLYTPTNTSRMIDLFIKDDAEPKEVPRFVGRAKAGDTAVIPYQTNIAKSIRVFGIAIDDSFQATATNFEQAAQGIVSVPATYNLAIGNSINGSTAQRLLYVGAGGVLAQASLTPLSSIRMNAAGTALEGFTPLTGLSVGLGITGGGANRVLHQDGSQNLAANANFVFDGGLKITRTSEQFRASYDASNYATLTVGSTGTVEFDAAGTAAGFNFLDTVTLRVFATNDNLKFDADANYWGIYAKKDWEAFGVPHLKFSKGALGTSLLELGFNTILTAAGGSIILKDTSSFLMDSSANIVSQTGRFLLGHFSFATAAKFEARNTADAQIAAVYDGSNYMKLTVNATGGVTLDAVGSGAKFIFADAMEPASLSDAAAPNNSIYYSTTASKLVYKDAGGTVNALY